MSNAAEQATSTRSDARGFADAFAAADDAFTFDSSAGESRTLTLAELGRVLDLDTPSERSAGAPMARREPSPREQRPAPRRPARSAAGAARSSQAADGDDTLLTLEELGDALVRQSARAADDLDFDFGTSANERARQRTAARLHASPSARRRVSGAASTPRRASDGEPEARRRAAVATPEARAAVAGAAASAAELLADPRPRRFGRDDVGAGRSHRERADDASGRTATPGRSATSGRADDASSRLDAARALPVEARPSESFLAGPDGRRTVEITGRLDAPAHRLREVERPRPDRGAIVDRLRANPDRIAMWAVLLGIVLILIAFTSGSAGAIALPVLAL